MNNQKLPEKDKHAEWLNTLLDENPSIKPAAIGRHLEKVFGLSNNSGATLLTRVLKGRRSLKIEEIPAILDFFETMKEIKEQKSIPSVYSNKKGSIQLPVYDLEASAGCGAMITLEQKPDRYWDIPNDMLPFSGSGRNLAVIRVRGDSMIPDLNDGDRVVVDLDDKHPSPAGIFVLDDGKGGVVIKRVELLFHQKPEKIRIISSNTYYPTYEVNAEQISISGRVILKIGKV